MKAVTYSRVSTTHHDQNPDIQVQELRAYCSARSWQIIEEIADYGSGSSDKREGLQRLLKLARSEQIECIVVTKLDRLFRSLRQLITVLDELSSLNIAFVAMKDSIDYTTPSGRLFTQILGSLAEFERSLIRERTIAGLEYARNVKGKRLGRPQKIHNIELIEILRAQGLSVREIGKLVGLSHSTVARIVRSSQKR